MPKVLVYRSELLPLSETFIKEQILAYKGWEAVLIGMRAVNELPLDGLDVRVLRPHRAGYLNRLRWKISRMRYSIPSSAVNMLKRVHASLLHAHFGPDALEAWPIARALDLPLLVTLHGYDINVDREWWEAGHGGAALKDYPARLLNLAQEPRVHFISVSDAIRRRAILFGIPEDKISTRRIGIDLTKFVKGRCPMVDRQPRVLFVGRLIEKKGCEYLIRAFALIQRIVPSALLLIAGDGDQREKLHKMATDLGVRAEFRGAIPHSAVLDELKLAKVFCLPSIIAKNGDAEGLPIVMLEAQASGVPVVASASGGMIEAISEGVTGFAVPERNVNAIAAKIASLLTDHSLADSMATEGPKFIAHNYDINLCTQRLEALYKEIIALDAVS